MWLYNNFCVESTISKLLFACHMDLTSVLKIAAFIKPNNSVFQHKCCLHRIFGSTQTLCLFQIDSSIFGPLFPVVEPIGSDSSIGYQNS